MKKYFKRLNRKLKEIINLAAWVSGKTSMPAYLVGGFLRDLILGVENFDLDIAVEGSGIIFAKMLARKIKAELRTHERFGTATLVIDGFLKIDIATTRSEKYPSCGLLPIVRSGSLRDDLLRRDFTVNAMAACISRSDSQELIDPFGGKKDLLKGKIRILHDLSFQDDPTRILRAIRFEQRFNFTIEPKTLFFLKQAIEKGSLDKVSPQRIGDELILMLKEHCPFEQIKRLNNLCTLSFISKKLTLTKSTYDLFKSIDKQILWFKKSFPTYRKLDAWLIYFMALLAPVSLREIKKVTSKFGLRKGETRRIISYFRLRHKLIPALSKKGILPSRIFKLLKPLSYETIILLKSTAQNKFVKEHINNFFEIYNGMRIYVSGNDLAGLGILPGPKYQKIFAKVLEAKLNGRIKSRRDELILIKGLIK